MPIWVGVAKVLIKTGIVQYVPSVRRLMGAGVPFLQYYSSRILASPNVELKAAQSILENSAGDVIDLSQGAPLIDSSLLDYQPGAEPQSSGYPFVAGLPELRGAVADKLRSRNGLMVDPIHDVLVCNGVSQAISLVLDTFVDPGERVVVFDPSFFIYRLAAQNRCANVAQVPTWVESGQTTFTDRDLRKALKRAKVIFVNSPANPTGGVFSSETLERIAFYCKKYNVLIFSDEVYEFFQYDGRHHSIGAFPSARNRTLTANGFSKSHGMAAYRLGYVAGPRYLVQPMLVTYLATAPFVSIASQRMGLAALRQPQSRQEELTKRFAARRQSVSNRLMQAGLPHSMPAGAFYFWIPIRHFGCTGAQLAQHLLLEERVLVMPGDSCGKSGKDYIRISYSGDGQQLSEGLLRLAHFSARHAPNVFSIAPVPTDSDSAGDTVKPHLRKSA